MKANVALARSRSAGHSLLELYESCATLLGVHYDLEVNGVTGFRLVHEELKHVVPIARTQQAGGLP